MTKEKRSAFTKRITQANKSEIIVILFEIFFTYMEDAKCALTGEKDYTAANNALRHASMVLEHLKSALDFKYEIANQLFPLYVFGQKEIARTMYLAEVERIDEVEKIIRPLQEAFIEVAKQDTTDTVMQNTQKMVAGYTYGRSDVNETMADINPSRGFFA